MGAHVSDMTVFQNLLPSDQPEANKSSADAASLNFSRKCIPETRGPNMLHPMAIIDLDLQDTLRQTNIAMGNPPFEDVSPIKNGGFPLLC